MAAEYSGPDAGRPSRAVQSGGAGEPRRSPSVRPDQKNLTDTSRDPHHTLSVIALLTDSTCDLPPEHARQLGIHVVPLTVHLRERRLYDWQDIDPDAVYDHMKTGGMATTAPVEVEAFTRRYRTEMKAPEAEQALNLLAVLSHTSNLSLGCYCETEARCHRGLLRELLAARGAHLA